MNEWMEWRFYVFLTPALVMWAIAVTIVTSFTVGMDPSNASTVETNEHYIVVQSFSEKIQELTEEESRTQLILK